MDEALVDDLTRRYWLRAEEDVPDLFPEVLDVLEDLRRDGHTLVVSSGSIPSSVERKTRVTGIDHLFRLALGSDEDVAGLAKGPGHFAMIMDALDVTDFGAADTMASSSATASTTWRLRARPASSASDASRVGTPTCCGRPAPATSSRTCERLAALLHSP